jgi:Putative auto-transporter adhesin, head GIN domain
MKKITIVFLLLSIMLVSNAQKVWVNDADAEIRSITGSFNSIKVSGGIDIFLSQGDDESLAVSASKQEYKQYLKTVITNNVLEIYYDGSNGWNGNNKKLKVYIAFKNLEKIKASGASDVQVAGAIEVPNLVIECSGASDFKGAVKVQYLKLELSGASDAKINGLATEVTIASSGASDVKGYDLIVDTCTAKASGASDINITVNKSISANASGASDIYYKGNATIADSVSSGASTIAKKG